MKKSARQTQTEALHDAVATAEALFSLGLREAQAIVTAADGDRRWDLARSLCCAVLDALWTSKTETVGCKWELRAGPATPSKRYPGLVQRIAGALSSMSQLRAGFLAGQLYTALLPETVRKTMGAYYTPPPLVSRLLSLVDETGLDWAAARVIDPACGGAAFLASVAPRMVAARKARTPLQAIADIEARLVGVEVDSFAAWMSMVLLDIALLETAHAAGRPLKAVVIAQDAFKVDPEKLESFDLVIGNPPYGKVSLAPAERSRFKASLFGHANLYGVFTELAVRLASQKGTIAYVTPTSFLGGEYFKNLRKLLCAEAPLVCLDFVNDREGVFDGVLQETMLAVFRRGGDASRARVMVNSLQLTEPTEPVSVQPVGALALNATDGSAWLLPRTPEHAGLIERCNGMRHRLADYGFAVSTGQLVWNRHKPQLRAAYERHCYPIIWAEAVSADGTFHFQAARRTHLPYLKIEPEQDFLLNHEPCILVQRTTAKEQKRRLITAVLPSSFAAEYPGFIVENHLNMVYSLTPRPRVALRTIAALLNSATLDQVFRCINGSVAVSAYELNSLPLPTPDEMVVLQDALADSRPIPEVEALIASFYSPLHERNANSAAGNSRQPNRRVAA